MILVRWPEIGLTVTWLVVVPALPLVFLVAPGVWRNVCPFAFANQLPRLAAFGRAARPPRWLTRHGFAVAALAFGVLVVARKTVLDENGPMTAAVIAGFLVLAFVGGLTVQGKAGWCGTVCPLNAVQRVYARAPLVQVNHAHCRPCVGCMSPCVDQTPHGVTMLESSRSRDALSRQLLVGAAPGLALGYFAFPGPPGVSVVATALGVLAPALGSAGLYYLLAKTVAARGARRRHVLTSTFAAIAFAMFYLFTTPRVLAAAGWDHPLAVAGIQLLVVVGTVAWWYRDRRLPRTVALPSGRSLLAGNVAPPDDASESVVRFVGPGGTSEPATVRSGETLATVGRQCGIGLPIGCGAGSCGADVVTVLSGQDNLSKPTATERATLERMGTPAGGRLACVAHVTGPVSVSVRPPVTPPPGGIDPAVESVVVVGNGIAGLTAADRVRRLHPDCEVHLIGQEPHHTYNRMALTQLVVGHTELTELGVLPPDWLAEQGITTHLGTTATGIDPEAREVTLDSGERLSYDRLILATGAAAARPRLPGLHLPGAYVLRTAEEALAIRRHASNQPDRKTAVVVGAGPLGVEVAAALSMMGLHVHLVDRHPWPARRLVDERAGQLLQTYLASVGVEVRTGVTVRSVNGFLGVNSVSLTDTQRIHCDLFLMCTGTTPDVSLARAAGLHVRTGIVVDETMRTSRRNVFAAGDNAEHPAGMNGLWSTAIDQSEVAAEQAVARLSTAARQYRPGPAATRLNLPGLDVISLGRIRPIGTDTTVTVFDDPPRGRYIKVVLSRNGQVAGAVAVEDPTAAAVLESAAARRVDARPHVAKLRAGDVSPLADPGGQPRGPIRRTRRWLGFG